jgi:hypothetical protein
VGFRASRAFRNQATDPSHREAHTGSLPDVSELSAEDQKLMTLARATMARTRAPEGAAVRDLDGRTYAAASVDLPSLTLSALEVCVAMAVSSGARGLEAAVRLGDDVEPDLRAVRDLGGAEVVIHLGDPHGRLSGRLRGTG